MHIAITWPGLIADRDVLWTLYSRIKGCGLEVIYTMMSVLKIHHASLVCGAMARIGIPLGEITAFICLGLEISWWRHQMETFSALLAICAGNSPVPGEFPAQRPVTRSFDVFFDLRPNKRLSKQSWGWWFETLSRSLWRHCNDNRQKKMCYTLQRLCTPIHVLLWCANGRNYPCSSGLLRWHWGNHTIAPVPVKQPRKIWVNLSHVPAYIAFKTVRLLQEN